MQTKKYTPRQALLKMMNYCAYRERSHQEVRDKLYAYGLYKNEVENIIAELINNNYLNEERFAESYVSGHFNIKKWGKKKILQGLKQKNTSAYLVDKAINSIDDEDYKKTLKDLLLKKIKLLKNEKNTQIKKQKAARYVINKGYEPELVFELLEEILRK
jgi:regulatory protein